MCAKKRQDQCTGWIRNQWVSWSVGRGKVRAFPCRVPARATARLPVWHAHWSGLARQQSTTGERAVGDRATTRLACTLAGSRWLDEPAIGAGRPGNSRQRGIARSATARLPVWHAHRWVVAGSTSLRLERFGRATVGNGGSRGRRPRDYPSGTLAGSRWLDEPAIGAGRSGNSRQRKTARSSTARLLVWRTVVPHPRVLIDRAATWQGLCRQGWRRSR